MKLLIGLDAGINTGFAAFDVKNRVFKEVETYSFWETIYRLQFYYNELRSDKIQMVVCIEDVIANSPTFPKQLPEGIRNMEAYKNKISQGVGENKAHCKLLIEWCEDRKIPIERKRPTKASFTKLDAVQFQVMTGYVGRTSNHSRDAAMLVYGV